MLVKSIKISCSRIEASGRNFVSSDAETEWSNLRTVLLVIHRGHGRRKSRIMDARGSISVYDNPGGDINSAPRTPRFLVCDTMARF